MSHKPEQIKRIPVAELKPGMYVHDLDCGWMSHPFLRNKFSVRSDDQVRQIIEAGIKELYIDAGKGDDVIDAIPAAQIRDELEANMRAIASAQAPQKIQVSVAEELVAAKRIHAEAHSLVRNMMQDVRLGKLVQVEQVEPVVEQMTASILRNDGALSALCLIKNKDDYTFLHSVSVCALMISFARSLGLDPGQMKQAGIGGLLHDIGKTVTPDRILNKPDRLSDEEFAVMRNHSQDGLALLMKTPSIGDIPRTICIEHHERMDGSGYPKKLNGEQISLMGRLSAIVDVYDAITSKRCYRMSMAPTDVLRKMLEWSKFHFDPQHVQAFMRCIGIYPTGSLVRLASGKLAVVQEQNRDNLLAPRVRAFYDTTKVAHIKPLNIDLMHGTDKILSHESSDKWAMNPLDYLAVLS